jgi:hypothetical protein
MEPFGLQIAKGLLPCLHFKKELWDTSAQIFNFSEPDTKHLLKIQNISKIYWNWNPETYACRARTQTCRYERRKNATLERAFQIGIYSKLSVEFWPLWADFGSSGLIDLKRVFS